MENWRENIKINRSKLGLSQAQLALRMSTTQQTIANWEKGGGSPDLAQVALLSSIFDININDFFEKSDLTRNSGNKKNKVKSDLKSDRISDLKAHNTDDTTLVREPEHSYGNPPKNPIPIDKVDPYKDLYDLAKLFAVTKPDHTQKNTPETSENSDDLSILGDTPNSPLMIPNEIVLKLLEIIEKKDILMARLIESNIQLSTAVAAGAKRN